MTTKSKKSQTAESSPLLQLIDRMEPEGYVYPEKKARKPRVAKVKTSKAVEPTGIIHVPQGSQLTTIRG